MRPREVRVAGIVFKSGWVKIKIKSTGRRVRMLGREDGGFAMSSQENAPWDRRPGEGPEAFAAASAYFALGSGRTIEAVARECTKSVSLLRRWSARFGWVERAAAYDDHLAAIRQAAREVALAREARKWELRRWAALEQVFQDGQRLREKAQAMLAMPVTEEVVGPDGSVTVKSAGRWTFLTAAQMLRLASELAAGALEAATQPVENLSDAELEAISGVWPEGGMAAGG